MPSYVGVEYPHGVNKKYVQMLCDYLSRRYNFWGYGQKLLDVGAGTGDYARMFQCLKMLTSVSDYDLEGKWREADESYDFVFCKSVLEHISNTQHFLSETKRVLKEGGRAIFLVPDWNSQWRIFYDDSTHLKPFTRKGLGQAFKLAGFKDVNCEYFYQLPFTWRHRWLRWMPYILRPLPFKSVHIRFSKERMLLCTATIR